MIRYFLVLAFFGLLLFLVVGEIPVHPEQESPTVENGSKSDQVHNIGLGKVDLERTEVSENPFSVGTDAQFFSLVFVDAFDKPIVNGQIRVLGDAMEPGTIELDSGMVTLPSGCQRLLFFGEGLVPLAISIPPNFSDQGRIYTPRRGGVRFSLEAPPGGKGTVSLSYSFSEVSKTFLSVKWNKGLVRELFPSKISLATAATLPTVTDWSKSTSEPPPTKIKSSPLFALPSSIPVNPEKDIVLRHLPEGLILGWGANPTSIMEVGRTSDEIIRDYQFGTDGSVSFDLDAELYPPHAGKIQIVAETETLIQLEEKLGANLRGRLVMPSQFSCSLFDAKGEVKLSRVIRDSAGSLRATVGDQVQELDPGGVFSFTRLAPGEYALFGTLACEQQIAIFSWHGILDNGSDKDLGAMKISSELPLSVEVQPIGVDGEFFPASLVWPDGNAPTLHIDFEKPSDYVRSAFGSIDVTAGEIVHLFGLTEGVWKFFTVDRKQGPIEMENGFIRIPLGDQVHKIDIPVDSSVSMKVGLSNGELRTLRVFDIPSNRPNDYSIDVIDTISGESVYHSQFVPFSNTHGFIPVNCIVAQREYWIAIYESAPSKHDTSPDKGASFFGKVNFAEGADPISVYASKHSGIVGKALCRTPGGTLPRGISLLLVGVGDNKFPKGLPISVGFGVEGEFFLPGLPADSRLVLNSSRGIIEGDVKGQLKVVFD